MDGLLEEIAEIVQDAINKGGMYQGGADEAAAEILALIKADPEIKEALAGWGALNPLERAKVIGYPEA